jgi:hypothetical protein
MNDAGDILFTSQISGGTTTFALFRYHQSNGQIDVVAYNGQVLPGPNGVTFASPTVTVPSSPPTILPNPAFNSISMADNDRVSFNVSLVGGGNAIYQQSGTSTPVQIALAGQTAPSTGGGTLTLISSTPTVTLSNGFTYFTSPVAGGTAIFGEFLAAPGSIQSLMSTADVLPSSARVSLMGSRPKSAGHFVAFTAQKSGGQRSLFVSDLSTGTTSKITTESNASPPNPFGLASPPALSNYFLNENGQVAFQDSSSSIQFSSGSTNFVGTSPFWSTFTSQSCGTISLWSPSTGLTKIASPGDAGPISGSTFACASLIPGPLSPFNRSGQLAFFGILQFTTSGTTQPPPSGTAIFLYSPSGTISQLITTSQLTVFDLSAASLVPTLTAPINSSGQVAFGAQIGTQSGTTGFLVGLPLPFYRGFLFGSAGNANSKVAGMGDIVQASASAIGDPHFISGLDDNGNLAFTASFGTAADAVFLAPAGGNIQNLAFDGGTAPGGGTFSLSTTATAAGATSNIFSNIALMNNEADIAFRAGITGGTGNSGYFRQLHAASGTGSLQPVVVQGQTVPGGGTFNAFPVPDTQGADFALGPDGKLAFVNSFTSGSTGKQGLFVARTDGTLLKVLATGDTVPGGGTLNALSMSQGLAAGDAGKFAFWAGIQGGSAQQAIYATALSAGTAGTTATLGSSQTSPVFGQQVTLSATVSSSTAGAPSGTVSFFDNGVPIGSGNVNASGLATLNISSLSVGAHPITAQYSGDANFAPTNSAALSETVGIRSTSTAMTSSLSSLIGGQAVTFTATVTTSAGILPTGTVTFLDGTTSIGTGSLNSSATATLNTTSLSVAAHTVTARYDGDVNSAISTSTAVNETVNIAGFATPPANLVVTAGQTLPISLTLYAAPGSNLSFTIGCSGLPLGATCSFGTNPVIPGAPPTGTTVQVNFSTSRGSSALPIQYWRPAPLGAIELTAAMFLLLIACSFGLRHDSRRRLALSMCLAMVALSLTMIGCSASGSSSPATPKGVATFTVTGTSSTATVNASLNVTVQ